jgi:hypothetical protein
MNLDNNTLYVALTCDTDADAFDPSLGCIDSRPGWQGVEIGIPAMFGAAEEVAESYGLKPKFTWFVRVDDQVEYYHGNACYLLERYSTMWRHRKNIGDEIAWHPHIYKFENNVWSRETDPAHVKEIICRNYKIFSKCEAVPKVCRIGESWFDNDISALLDDLGIICDSTAMPGRMRQDDYRTMDWRKTPQKPYHPSIGDYQVPGKEKRKYLEVPMSMIKVKASYDKEAYYRYIDLSFHHNLMKGGIEKFISKENLLVSMTHPSGVLSCISPEKGHGLVSFSIDDYRKNLEQIILSAK